MPWHFSAFHPDYRMRDTCGTPPATLSRARAIAREYGLHYVYTGNDGRCNACGTACAGVFDAGPGTWGARRQPVRLADYR